MPPDDRTNEERHEAHAQEFIQVLDALLVDVLRLSEASHPAIFRRRSDLLRDLRNLLSENTWTAEARATKRIKEHIAKAVGDVR